MREDAILARAMELGRQRAAQIVSGLKSASNFAAAAKAQGFEAKDTQLIARQSALPDVGVSPEIDRVAFAMKVGDVSSPITTGDGTVIVRLAERDDVTPDELKQARDTFRAELLNERRGLFFNAYLSKVKEGLKVDVRTDVLRRITNPRP